MILKRWVNEMTIENGNNRIASAVTKKIKRSPSLHYETNAHR